MKMLSFLSVCAIVGSAFAQDPVPACNPNNYGELISCINKTSIEIAVSEQQLKAANELADVAKQWINPDLDFETLSKGSDRSETTASLMFNLRLGGKRGAGIAEAEAEIDRAQAQRNLDNGQIRLSIMLSMYRLAHLQQEIILEEESGSTFNKIVQQFQRKQALSPEEKVSVSVFKIAAADHRLSLSRLKTESESIQRQLAAVTGIEKSVFVKLLPSKKTDWPSVSPSQEGQSPQLKLAAAQVKLAESQRSKAEADSWPDVKIGPVIRTQREAGVTESFSGVGVSLPLPIFSVNGGGRAYARSQLLAAQMNFDLEKRKTQSERDLLVMKYDASVAQLGTSINEKELDDRHATVEREFFRGLVSGAIVIEAHRQLFQFVEKRNQTEMEALEALGRILIYDNKFNEVVL